MRSALFAALASLVVLLAAMSAAQSMEEEKWDRSMLPIAPKPFKGHAGLRTSESQLDFPAEVKAPKGAPNILLIMPDDVGFGASTPFGGPVPTEAFNRLAAEGLLFTEFHTTALCSPTRASLITGRNHHSNATGVIMEIGTGFPGYNSLMPKSNGTIAEILKANGYNTAWYGKNHNGPAHALSRGVMANSAPVIAWPNWLCT